MTMTISGNVIIPAFAGILFFLFFAYYYFTRKTFRMSNRFLLLFLSTFSVFLFTRPVQLLFAGYHWPLIVADIRFFLLCAVVGPSFYLFSESLYAADDKRKNIGAFLLGGCFGVVYAVFHTLGTVGTMEIFAVGDVSFYDNVVPLHRAPFFGREVSLSVQIAVPVIFFITPFFRNVFSRRPLTITCSRDSAFLINAAVFIFALSMVIGSLTLSWVLFYAVSVVSVILVGYAISINFREILRRNGIIVDVLREEFSLHPSYLLTPGKNINSLVSLSGLVFPPDSVMLCRMDKTKMSFESLVRAGDLHERMKPVFDGILGVNEYLFLSLSNTTLIIYFSAGRGMKHTGNVSSLSEFLRKKIGSRCGVPVSIGVGRPYRDISKLYLSYQEAYLALDYAVRSGGNAVAYESMDAHDGSPAYPFDLKDGFLSALKSGNLNEIMKSLSSLTDGLLVYAGKNIPFYRALLTEIAVFSAEEMAFLTADRQAILKKEHEFFSETASSDDVSSLNRSLEKMISAYTVLFRGIPRKRSNEKILRAKQYVLAKFSEPLSVDSLARSMHMDVSYLTKMFKEQENVTLHSFILQTRLDKAKDLIACSTKSITEIAYNVGFNDSNYFSTVFKKHLKISPFEYRKIIQKER
jgi:two-component system response regulator YesN